MDPVPFGDGGHVVGVNRRSVALRYRDGLPDLLKEPLYARGDGQDLDPGGSVPTVEKRVADASRAVQKCSRRRVDDAVA